MLSRLGSWLGVSLVATLVSLLVALTSWSTDWIGPTLGVLSAMMAGLKKFADEARPHLDVLKARYPEKAPEKVEPPPPGELDPATSKKEEPSDG